MSQSVPQVFCVILNWNNYTDTSECIDSLRQLSYDEFEVIVVDNGSSDGSGNRLREKYEDVTVLFTDRNLGFGGGNNRGIREAMNRGADYIWVLNDDVLIPESSTLSKLVSTLEENSDIGVVSPIVTEYPDTDKIWFREGYIDWRSGRGGHRGARRKLVDLRLSGSKISKTDELIFGDYLPFCSALVRTQIFEELGLYPEEYFLYYGDIDFCAQMRYEGFKIATHTGTKIYHKVSASSETRRSSTHLYYLSRNRLLFKRRWKNRVSCSFYLIYVWWVVLNTVDLVYSGNWLGLQALALGIFDGIRGQTGRGRYP